MASYKDKLIAKYGQQALSGQAKLSQLEQIAKDIQREANRRYQIARNRPEMRNTRAYKQFVKSGGLIALSKGSRMRLNPATKNLEHYIDLTQQTPLQRSNYLRQQIARGLDYLEAQTSSVSGYREWKRNSIAAATRSLSPTVAAKFANFLQNDAHLATFWDMVRKFEEANAALYYRLGSDVIVNNISILWTRQGNKEPDYDTIEKSILDEERKATVRK